MDNIDPTQQQIEKDKKSIPNNEYRWLKNILFNITKSNKETRKNPKSPMYLDLIADLKSMQEEYGEEELAQTLNDIVSELTGHTTFIKDNEYLETIMLSFGAFPKAEKYLAENLTRSSAALFLENMVARKGKSFDPTLISMSTMNEELQNIQTYFINLYDRCQNHTIETPIDKTFIIIDSHWRDIHVQISLDGNGNPAISILLIDSVPNLAENKDPNSQSFKFLDAFISIALESFKGNATLYDSQVTLQKDGKSCPIYALVLARMLHSLDHGKFHMKYKSNLFRMLASENADSQKNSHGLTVVPVHSLPAKLLKTTQLAIEQVEALQKPVNSRGDSLLETLEKNEISSGKDDKKLNAFTSNWYEKMMQRMKRTFQNKPNIEDKIKEITLLEEKFSTNNLSINLQNRKHSTPP